MDNTWLVVAVVLLSALILGLGLPFLYMSGRAHIDKALDDTRIRLLREGAEWAETQARTINRQDNEIQMLQQDLAIERDARQRLTGRMEQETEYSKQLKAQIEVLNAQVTRLEADRDSMTAQLLQQQQASDVYRATLVVLLLQMQQHNIRPKINTGLLDVVRKDGKATQLLQLVEEYLQNGG